MRSATAVCALALVLVVAANALTPTQVSLDLSSLSAVCGASASIAGQVQGKATVQYLSDIAANGGVPTGTLTTGSGPISISWGTNASPGSFAATAYSNGAITSATFWSVPGSKTVTATYNPTAASGNGNRAGVLAAETTTVTVTVSSAASEWLTAGVPTSAQTTDPYKPSVQLRRVKTGTVDFNLGGVTVTFTLLDSAGNALVSKTAVTSTGGVASLVNDPFTVPDAMAGNAFLQLSVAALPSQLSACYALPPTLRVPVTVTAIGVARISAPAINAICSVPSTASVTFTDVNSSPLPGLTGLTWDGPATNPVMCSSLSPLNDQAQPTTSATGVLTCAYTATDIVAGTGSYHITYGGAAGERLPSDATGTVSVRKCRTQINVVSAPANKYVLGQVFPQYTVTLTRNEGSVTTPLGANFVVSLLDNGAIVASGITNPNGQTDLFFSPTVNGVHSLSLSYLGDSGCYESASLAVEAITVYNPVNLQFDPIQGVTSVCVPADAQYSGGPVLKTKLSKALSFAPDVPTDVPVTITYGVSAFAPAATTVSGVAASVSVRSGFATGSASLTTSARISAAVADQLFLAPVTGGPNVDIVAVPTGTLKIAQSATTLALVSPVLSAAVGAVPTFSAALARTGAPAGPLEGRSIIFDLYSPEGVVATLTGVTNAQGVATVSFAAYSAVGSYFVGARYVALASPYPSESKILACEAAVTAVGATIAVKSNIKVTLSPVSGVCGQALTFSALVTTDPGNAPVTQVPLQVTISAAGGLWTCDASTNAQGVATCSVVIEQGISGSISAVAIVSPTSQYGAVTSNSVSVSVTTVTSALANLVALSTEYVGAGLAVSTKLTRQGGAGLGGRVIFTLSGPTGADSTDETYAIDSDADTGNVVATFQLLKRGLYTIRANFAGDGCRGASVSNTINLTVLQKVVLVANAKQGICSDQTTVTCSLYHSPQGPDVPARDGLSVSFSLSGGTSPLTAVATTAGGVASIVRVFSPPATYTVTCSFSNPTGEFYRNTAGGTSTTSSAAVTINFIQTALSPFRFLGSFTTNNNIPMETTLTTTTPPAGTTPRPNLFNELVTFTMKPPSQSTQYDDDRTDANGVAQQTWGTQNTKGVYRFTASYAARVCYAAAATITQDVPFYQRAKLTITPANAVCGASITYGARLTQFPNGGNLDDEDVVLDFGGAVPAVTLNTDNSGRVSYTTVVPNAGAYLVSASFSNPSAYYTNSAGAVPPAAEVASFTSVIDSAAVSLTQPVVSATVIYINQALSAYSVLRRTVSPTGNIVNAPVAFVLTRLSDNTVVATQTANTDSNGKASVSFAGTLLNVNSQYSIVAKYAGTSCNSAVTTPPTVVTMNQKTTLTLSAVNGATCEGPTPVTATLAPSPLVSGSASVAGLTIVFKSGSRTCNGVTNAAGVATCNLQFSNSGSATLTANFYATGIYESSSASVNTNIGLSNTIVVLSTPVTDVVGQSVQHAVLARGQPARLAAKLSFNGAPVVGRTVKLTIGTTFAQSCTDVTDSNGEASCLTATLYQPLGPLAPISISFTGDSCYVASSGSAVALVFAFPGFGAFAVGDLATGTDRTFLANTDQAWFAANPMSQSTQINDNFRGYGNDIRAANGAKLLTPVCGGYMNSGQWDHLTLPQALPQYVGVIKSTTAFYNPRTGSGGSSGNTNDCSGNPCYNGGTCRNSYGGGYFCDCTLTRHGLRCERNGFDSPGYPRGNGKGCGLNLHGNGNPSDTTVNSPSIVVLQLTYGNYCNGKTDRPNDGHLDGEDGHDDHHGNDDDGDHHDDDEDDDQRRKGDHRSVNQSSWWDWLASLFQSFHNNKPTPGTTPATLIQSQCNAAKTLKGTGKYLADYCNA